MPRHNRHARAAAIERDKLARQAVPGRHILAGLSPSWAQRQQGEVGLRDLLLADRARLIRPGVRWWWGERPSPDEGPAYCYLCDAYITSYDRRWPITDTARAAILAHRDQAHGADATPTGSTTPTTKAGVDQQTGGST